MLFRSYGLFWRVDRVDWGWRGKGNQGRLLGITSQRAGEVDFREQRGIYALYNSSYELIYVGQTGAKGHRLFNRLKSHKFGFEGRFTYFSWFGLDAAEGPDGERVLVECEPEAPTVSSMLNHLEAVVIAIAEPSQNRQGGRFGDAEYFYQSYEDPDGEYDEDFEEIRERLAALEKLVQPK